MVIKFPIVFYLVTVGLLVIYSSCSNHADANGRQNEAINSSTEIEAVEMSDTLNAGARDTVILLKDGQKIIKGHIITHKAQISYMLPAWKGQQVTAYLQPLNEGGNVCIRQVTQAGIDSEGPFADTLHYTVKDNGNLYFVIGENLVKGEPYTGEFLLFMQVK